jgi:hypothetical protein
MPHLLELTNPQLIALVRARENATALEVHLAERLDEARAELDECIKNFAEFLVAEKGPVGAVGLVTSALERR